MKKLVNRIVEWNRAKNWACDTYENQFVLGHKFYRDATTLDQRAKWAEFCVMILEKVAELSRARAYKIEHDFGDELTEMKLMVKTNN